MRRLSLDFIDEDDLSQRLAALFKVMNSTVDALFKAMNSTLESALAG